MHIRRSLGKSVAIALAGSLAASLLISTPASADDGSSADAKGVSDIVLEQTPEDQEVALADILTPTEGADGDLVVQDDAGTLAALLPAEGDGEVISASGVGIGLPAEADTQEAEVTSAGIVSYAGGSEADTSVAVLSTAERTRILTVIPDEFAPREYSYPISDARPVLNGDGTVDLIAERSIWTPEGELAVREHVVGTFAKPWASDATGSPVTTRFEVVGSTVVQIIDVDETTVFPVVADPDAWWWIGTAVGCAAEVAALLVAWAKIPTILTKMNKIIKNVPKLKAAVDKLGGAKKAIEAIKQYAANKSKLSVASRNAVKALAAYGVSMLSDLLGIGSCVSLIRGS